jgi:hypothetical protein
MWSWIFKVSIISFLFIFLLHYLYSFFKTTLTSPKIKDLVNKPMRKYDSIYDSLQNNQSYIEETEGVNISNALHSNSTYTQNPVKQNMKDELKKYLSELSGSGNKMNDNNNNNNNNNNNINTGANSIENSMTTPAIPDFSMSNMSSSSSSSFSSSYAEF